MSEKTSQGRHNIILENRSRLLLTGITEVERFDESEMKLFTELGELRITGVKLHISDMSVGSGELNVEGEINSMTYESRKTHRGLFSKIKG